MSGSLNARTELAEGERAEPASQTLCQLERREEVNPLVSGYCCLKGAGKKRENHLGLLYMMLAQPNLTGILLTRVYF